MDVRGVTASGVSGISIRYIAVRRSIYRRNIVMENAYSADDLLEFLDHAGLGALGSWQKANAPRTI